MKKKEKKEITISVWKKILLGIFFILFAFEIVLTILDLCGVIKKFDYKNVLLMFSSTVACFSIIVVFYQIEAQHEKDRRVDTLESIKAWNDNYTYEMMCIRKIVEQFTEEQCRRIFNYETIVVSYKIYEELRKIFPQMKEVMFRKKDMEISQDIVNQIRYCVVKYLNTLEFTLEGWKMGVFDKEIIFEQFDFIIDKKEGKNILENFRNAAGGEKTYPAIAKFCITMEERRKEAIVSKGNLGK